MKQTEKWLPIAQKKAQSELTFLRLQVRAINAFQSINHLPELNEQRRELSSQIRSMRYWLKNERYTAILRGDLSEKEYRPSPPTITKAAEIIPFEPISTETKQRELLLVG